MQRKLLAIATSVALIVSISSHLAAQPPASAPSFPIGDVTKYTFNTSKIFPGTTRDYWIYIPKQYDPAKPACLFVDQDNVQFKAPAIFDQLIAQGKMPVTIGIFIAPGRVPASTTQALDRFNRSYEFDTLSDDYAKFLLDELLPDAEKQTAPDKRAIHLSKNPDDRAIGGSSSGAIAAFTVAWERNDSFHRVFSSIGTYVGLRAGNIYPTLIRKYDPKTIRIYLEDGSNDNNTYGGDWWMANQEMERALTFSGYEVAHNWGEGPHSSVHATEIFSEAMQWLWKDYPKPITTGQGSERLKEILIPGEPWKLVQDKLTRSDGTAVNAAGEVFFNNPSTSKTYKVSLDGKVSPYAADSPRSGQAFGPDGKLYVVTGMEVRAYSDDTHFTVLTDGFHGNDITVASNGNVYITESGSAAVNNQVWLVTLKGEKKVLDATLKFPNGIALSPDQSLLYVTEFRSHWVYSYQIQPDGTLAYKQKFYDLYVRDVDDDAGPDGIRTDRDGRLYVTTRAGIQVCDQAGKVMCIMPLPTSKASTLTFGGADFDILYAMCGDKVYAPQTEN